MFIRELDGAYAGQVREFPAHIALELIAAGRAVNPFHEVEDTPAERQAEKAKPAKAKMAKGGR